LHFPLDHGDDKLMADVVESVRQVVQDFIAPELPEFKSDLKRVDNKIDSETKRLEERISSETRQLGADFKRLELKMDGGFAHLQSLLENANLRAELESTRDIADLRERVKGSKVNEEFHRQ
jgi:type I site-specific restriction endonuclease